MSATQNPDPAPTTTIEEVKVQLGDAETPLVFKTDISQQRFPYSILIRLVEPRTSIVTKTWQFATVGAAGAAVNAKLNIPLADRFFWHKGALPVNIKRSFSERVAIDRPISVDSFRDQLIGNENGVITEADTVPLAATLGLGYILRLAQKWTPAGLSLGDLVYSLPLAPGEQQRIAVFEQRQTLTDQEIETLDVQEQQRFRQENDSSSEATFNSAFEEALRGASHYSTHAESSSWGASGGFGLSIGPLVLGGGGGGGGGSSSASGNSSQSLDGARNYASRAAENMHASVERQASARRRAQRTSIRLATSTETESVRTKVITNNNRAHALTIQYWQVLRHFDVSTAVEGVQLTAFVPLDIVRWIPAGQPLALPANISNTRPAVLSRYAVLHKHSDTLRNWLPLQYREGLNVLEEFVANPSATPDLNSFAEEVLSINLRGAVLPFDDLWVSAVTRRGTRIGPVALKGAVPPIPDRLHLPNQSFSTERQLLDYLHGRRNGDTFTDLSATLALPNTVSPEDIVGFEVTRSTRTLHYQFVPNNGDGIADVLKGILGVANPINPLGAIGSLGGALGGSIGSIIGGQAANLIHGITLTPERLENELGGPFFVQFRATINSPGGAPGETYASGEFRAKVQLPPTAFPIPALQVRPRLKFSSLLKIEQTLQHAVRNTVTYSRAVWMSLTAEERAILLEAYTIGVPSDGITDETQHIPLLNCVANQVLGFFGNCMIMPFSLPPVLARRIAGDNNNANTPITSGQIQDALSNFHKTAFSPPVSRVTLPTHGVLGEAVLGQMPSAEKIDLTRFWNWQDSPIPQASDISPIQLGAVAPLTTSSAPNTLTGMPSIINNSFATPPTTATPGSLVQQLIAARAAEQPFQNITGAAELATLTGKTLDTAESARKDALATAQSMASKALDKLPEVLKAKAEAEAAAKKVKDSAKADGESAFKGITDLLKGNATSFLDVANAFTGTGAQGKADDFAKSLLGQVLGDNKSLPTPFASQLFSTFAQKTGGGALTQGGTAFLKALGLPF